MTVEDLIAALQQLDPEALVSVDVGKALDNPVVFDVNLETYERALFSRAVLSFQG